MSRSKKPPSKQPGQFRPVPLEPPKPPVFTASGSDGVAFNTYLYQYQQYVQVYRYYLQSLSALHDEFWAEAARRRSRAKPKETRTFAEVVSEIRPTSTSRSQTGGNAGPKKPSVTLEIRTVKSQKIAEKSGPAPVVSTATRIQRDLRRRAARRRRRAAKRMRRKEALAAELELNARIVRDRVTLVAQSERWTKVLTKAEKRAARKRKRALKQTGEGKPATASSDKGKAPVKGAGASSRKSAKKLFIPKGAIKVDYVASLPQNPRVSTPHGFPRAQEDEGMIYDNDARMWVPRSQAGHVRRV